MAGVNQLSAMPQSFNAGNYVEYAVSFDLFPVTAWGMSLWMNGPSAFNVAATVVNGQFVVAIPATTTFLPGTYQWVHRVTGLVLTTQIYDADAGVVVVEPNIATASAGDLQPKAEKLLALVDTLLANRLLSDVDAYSVHGRMLQKMKLPDLRKLQMSLRREVALQRNPGGFRPSIAIVERPAGFPNSVPPWWPKKGA